MRQGRQQAGMALVLVLWVLVLVTIATSAFALTARMNQLEAHSVFSATRARFAAEAGLNMAALALRDPDDFTRWVADGRPYTMDFDGINVEVRITDERGKLDLNSADETVIEQLFIGHGLDADVALQLAAAVGDWIDQDDVERVNGAEDGAYQAAGLEQGPANRQFVMTEELLQVIGVPYELYRHIEPGITVYSRTPEPDAAYAPVEALLSLPDISHEEALNFIEERQSQEPNSADGAVLPGGQVVVARGRGLTYSIQAKATLPNGIWDQIEATIRLGGTPDGRPYRILRWREGFQH